MRLFSRSSADDKPKPQPNYREDRPGHFALLTVDLERHPEYEPAPVRFFLYGLSLSFLACDRDVEFKLGENGKKGASGWGVFDDETGELAYHERITLYPNGTFGWYLDTTYEKIRIQDQRDNPKIL